MTDRSAMIRGVAFALCCVTPWWLAISVFALVSGGDGAWSPLIGGGFSIGVASTFAVALYVIERRETTQPTDRPSTRGRNP